MNYYYYSTDGGEVAGPYPLEELKILLANRKIPNTTQVCPEGQDTWRLLADLLSHTTPNVPLTRVTSPTQFYPASKMHVSAKQSKPLILFCSVFAAVVLAGLVLMFSYEYLFRGKPVQQSTRQTSTEPIPTTTPIAPTLMPVVESADYQNFLRVSRRLVTAIQSGISFDDFHERAVDVLASAKEALRVVQSPVKREIIEKFALAITDADDLWHYKMTANQDVNWLILYRREGDSYSAEQLCSDRWDSKFSELITAYHLDVQRGDPLGVNGDYWYILIDPSIAKIFVVCTDTFTELDQP
jgi:hypothetical protein